MEKPDDIVAVFKKNQILDGLYLYTFDYLAAGKLDEATGDFYDVKNDLHYKPFLKGAKSRNTTDIVYDDHVKVSEMEAAASDTVSVDNLIQAFEDGVKPHWMVAHLNEDNQLFYMDSYDYVGKKSYVDSDEDDPELDRDYTDETIMDFIEYIYDTLGISVTETKELEDLRDKAEFYGSAFEDAKESLDFELEQRGQEAEYPDLEVIHQNAPKLNPEERLKADKEKGEIYIGDDKDIINIDALYDRIRKSLIAQDDPAYRLITEVSKALDSDDDEKDGILLTGSTGVGKTFLMSLLAKYLERPFLSIDSTQLTTPGYTGKHIEEFLWDLYVDCGKDISKAEKAIIFFDEIDKKGSSSKSDVGGRGVLNVLLKFMDGTTYSACQDTQNSGRGSIPIKTNNMLVIAGGAFEDVYKAKRKRQLGFGSDYKEDEYIPSVDDFVKKAMMPDEFMGRFPTIIHLNDLDIDSLRRILTESDKSPLLRQEKSFSKLGVKLTTTPDYLTAVAEKADNHGSGARALKGIVAETTWRPYAKINSDLGKEQYEECILDKECVDDSKAYQLVKKRSK